MLTDYYKILGVSLDADLTAIKAAYHARAMVCHPDHGGSHEQMLVINEAWEVLSNPTARRIYDEARKIHAAQSSVNAAEANARDARQRAETYPRRWSDFEIWMDSFLSDFTEAEYGESGRWPTVRKSASGAIFMVAGIVAAIFLIDVPVIAYIYNQGGSGWGALLLRLAIFAPIAGAWVGIRAHQILRHGALAARDIKGPQPKHENCEAKQSTKIINCPKCGQSLRIPDRRERMRITCKACASVFFQH